MAGLSLSALQISLGEGVGCAGCPVPKTAKGILLEGLEREEGRTGEHRQTDRLTVATQTEGGKAEVPTGFHPTPWELDRPGSSGQAPKALPLP